jgi:membrane protein
MDATVTRMNASDRAAAPPTARRPDVVLRLLRFLVAVARRFYGDQCFVRASALAYTSLLSIVPLLAVMFAVLKGLGVQRRLEPLLLSRLSLDPATTQSIIGYIDQTNVRALGALGAAALLLTVVGVLGSIEAGFNHIWRVRQGRALWRKVTDYLGVVLLTPFLLLVAVAITSSLQVQRVLEWVTATDYVGGALLQSLRLVPIVFNAVALAVLYAVLPNRRQSAAAVLLGAAVAGAAWQLVQWTYVTLQIGVAQYNAIYGALSQLPVTLVWLYVSWIVVLAGAELAAVYEFGVRAADGGQGIDRAAVALHILVRAAQAFQAGAGPLDPRILARQLGVDAEVVSSVVATLEERGWLLPVADPPGYILGVDPSRIDLAPLDALQSDGAVPRGCDPLVAAALDAVATAKHGAWAQWCLADVLRREGTADR